MFARICRTRCSVVGSSLLLVSILGMLPLRAEALGRDLFRDDPAAAEIVGRLEQESGGAPVVVLAKQKLTDPVSGFAYTLVKARVGLRDVTAVLNEATESFALDSQLPEREAQELLGRLPRAYQKMGLDLIAQIREAQGGRLAAEKAAEGIFDVTFYADSSEALDAIVAALGPAAEDRFDAVQIYLQQTAGLDKSESLAPPPQIRSVRARIPLAIVLKVGALDIVSSIEPTLLALARLNVSVPRVGGDTLRGYGLQGATARVAIVDSGVDDTHPDLPFILAANKMDFTGSGTTDDTQGHGTHVAGIVRSTNATHTGMAIGAPLVNAKSLGSITLGETVDTAGGSASQVAAGLNFAQGRMSRIINGSYGFAGCTAPGMCNRPGMCTAPPGSLGNVCANNAACGVGGSCVVPNACTAPDPGSVGRPCVANPQCDNPAGANNGVCGWVTRICANNAACDIPAGAGNGRCVLASVCRAPAASVGKPCIFSSDCDTAAGAGNGFCGSSLRPCSTNANCNYPAATANGICSTPPSNGSGRPARDVDFQVYDKNITVDIAAEELGFHGRCVGGANAGNVCNLPEQCPGGTCQAAPSSPNDAFNVITVGSTDTTGPPSVVSSFSEVGPTVDARSKPDVVAPGGGTHTCDGGDNNGAACPPANCTSSAAAAVGCTPALSGFCQDGATRCTRANTCPGPAAARVCTCPCDEIDSLAHDWEGTNPDTVDFAGTSMATPHVSGLAALLWDFGSTQGILTDTPYIKAGILNNANRLAGWTRPSVFQPLDTSQGTGEINATETFRAYADDLRIWQQRVTGTAPKDSHWYWLDVTGASIPLTLTLAWERHVTDPTAVAPALNDLDLKLYSPTGTLLDNSLSTVDSVEHIVYNATQNGRYCVEVDPYNLSQGGSELYALGASRPPAGNVRDFRLNFLGNVNPCVPDFGDAPDPFTGPGFYPTLLAHNGARHLDWTKEWLGTSRPEIDGELQKKTLAVHSRVDPFPSVSGEHDALDPMDQDGMVNLVDHDAWDDGVVIPGPFLPGVPKLIWVTVQTTVDDTGVGANGRYQSTVPTKRLYLNAWADWNGDGFWGGAGEKIIGTFSPTGQVAIDPETFGTNGRYTIGEAFTDSNGSGRWEPGEPFTDTVGRTETTYSFLVTPPSPIAPDFYLRFRLDYGEDAGVVANVSGNLAQFVGEAQFGEVEDYDNRYEIDVFPESLATVDVRYPAYSSVPHPIELRGPTTVRVDLGAIGDTNGNGREQVPTQMVQLDLSGTDPTLGRVQVHRRDPGLDPFGSTSGEIEEDVNNNSGTLDLPPFVTSPPNLCADSYFNVYFQVDLPDLGIVLHNHRSKRMSGPIYYKPPREGDTYSSPDYIPLYDAGENLVALIGPGYHTPNTPSRPHEIDIFPASVAQMDIRFPAGGASEIVRLEGPTTVNVDIGGIADTDNNGREQVSTEITSLELRGTSQNLGPLIVRNRSSALHPYMHSTGQIEENSNGTPQTLDLSPFVTSPPGLTASSFFDVFFEVELPNYGGMKLHNHVPKHMTSTITHKPPGQGDTYQNPDLIPLYDDNENLVAEIGPGLHVPFPVNSEGACCIGGSSCFVGPPSQCESLGGRYVGDGSSCGGACFVASPPGVTNTLTIHKLNPSGSILLVSWNGSACPATDYSLLFGNASQLPHGYSGVYNLMGGVCSTGGGSQMTWNSPNPGPGGMIWALVVANDGQATEGAWGTNSGGVDRTGPGPGGSSGVCHAGKNLSNPCGQGGCTLSGGSCTSSTQCCSGFCNGGVCAQSCQLNGASCTSSGQCCSGFCSGGVCASPACVTDGGSCISSGECCSGFCYAGNCRPVCTPEGGSCSSAGQCCGGSCQGGLCQPPCMPNGGGCVSPGQCCSGNCFADRCCGLDGAACSVGAECCGGNCVAGVCQSMCSANGQSCSTPSQCCSGICQAGRCCGSPGSSCTSGTECCTGSCIGGVCQSGCTPNGQGCSTPSQCCSGICQAGLCCGSPGSSCTSGTQCCTGSCIGGVCQSGCTPNGQGCGTPSQCCSGICQAGLCCGSPGSSCTSPSQCCTGNCTGGICQTGCFPNGQACSTPSQCCSAFCQGGICQPPPCFPNGQPCSTPSQCCSSSCLGGFCQCFPNGQSCSSSTQCCAGSCFGGICQPGCFPNGQACSSPTQCCSGSCPFGVCQPCQPIGNSCSSHGECCSHFCSGGICQPT